MNLQRESPDPLYIQLKASLFSQIATGQYGPHQRLPSERELCQQFHVSRMTVRQALIDLARDGLIYTRTGKGTFVAQPKIDQQLRAVSGFSQDVRTRGGVPTSRVLTSEIIPATADVAANLRLGVATPVVYLARLRLSDGVPLAIESAFLPEALFPNILQHDFSTESLYDVLEQEYKLVLVQAEQTIEAALATAREAELLHATPPTAVLRMQRVTQVRDGGPVEFVLSVYRGDRYKFRSTLQPRANGQR